MINNYNIKTLIDIDNIINLNILKFINLIKNKTLYF